jgi:hypothetical protein
VVATVLRIACGGTATDPALTASPSADAAARDGAAPTDAAGGARDPAAGNGSKTEHVFVIAIENQDAARIYGDLANAPYINGTLIPKYAHTTAFADELPGLPSEPHYLWMEAGTNTFADRTFTTDDSPSAHNSTASRDHLVAQIAAAGGGLDWMAYQEGIDPTTTGACPLAGAGFYRPRHNPFVFFQDVAGNPPSQDAPVCAAHHRDLTALASDLASGGVASYAFISPDLCHDMHGATGCPDSNRTRAGDQWLAANLPPLIDFVNAKGGVIFITWEEGDHTDTLPFIAVGPRVKQGYAGAVPYTHSSLLKTVEELLGLPILPAVAGANDLSDLFAP